MANKEKKRKKKRGRESKKKDAATSEQNESSRPRVEGLNVPAWGEPLIAGKIGDNPVMVPVPLNEAALEEMTPLSAIGLVLTHRIIALEEECKMLRRDLNLHERIARLEAAMGEGPGSDETD